MPSPIILSMGCSAKCGSTSSCAVCRELDDIRKEIEMGEEIIRRAKTRRSSLLSTINSSNDVLTSRFPVEIICSIFEEYVKLHEMAPREYSSVSNHHRPRYFAAIHRSAPLRLGSICRKWRNIAWAHSRLWSTLIIAVSCPGHDLGPTMVVEWLERTGEQHLHIQMNEYRPNPDVPAAEVPGRPEMLENAKSIIQTLNSVSSRWHSLDFSGCPLEVLSELDNSGCCSESILEHISLGELTQARHATGVKLFRRSKHKHRPTHLNLLSAIRPSRINIEWIRLTRLYIENMSLKHLLPILQRATESAPALRHLSLFLVDDLRGLGLIGHAYNLRHPAIEYLAIFEDGCDLDTAAELFKSITLPALHSLRYQGNSLNDFPVREYLSFLKRSLCALENLEMVKPCIEDHDLELILHAMPSLCTLKLELIDEHRPSAFFDCLSQNIMERPATPVLVDPFLPNLEQLHLIAQAPRPWSTFIGIFAYDPTLNGADFAQTRPRRHALQVTFEVQSGIHRSHMDLISLSQLALLWEKYQFFAVFQSDDAKRKRFLIR